MSQPTPALTEEYVMYLAEDDLCRRAQAARDQLKPFTDPVVEKLLASKFNWLSAGMYRENPAAYATHLLKTLVTKRKRAKFERLFALESQSLDQTAQYIRAFIEQMRTLKAGVEAAKGELPDGLELPTAIMGEVVEFLLD